MQKAGEDAPQLVVGVWVGHSGHLTPAGGLKLGTMTQKGRFFLCTPILRKVLK
jgi:hypothetical protein